MNRIKELPKSSSHLLTSTQIVTSVHSVIKELIENSIDSSAKNIEVKLGDYGLEKIEVKDNGSGIHKDDIHFVAKPHCTSKITSHLDLDKVETYGFRGEALAALCAVSDLTISTKTCDDDFGFTYTFDHKGEILMSKPCPINQGTIVTALNLFKNVPVRKQLYRNNKVKKEELKKIENITFAFGCIQEGLRISLYHNQNLIWQKLSARSLSEGLQQVFGNCIFEHMENFNYEDDETKIKMELFLPKNNAPKICSLSSPCRSIVAVNKRPVRMKVFDKLIKESFNKTLESGCKSCYPFCYISITVPSTEVDVNFEPNKTAVAIQNIDLVLQKLSEVLDRFYSKDLIIETGSNINNSTITRINNDENSHNQNNQRDIIPAVQMNQSNPEPNISSEIRNDTTREINQKKDIFLDLLQKSQPKEKFEFISTRENPVISEKLSRKNNLMTPSSKKVKSSSNFSTPLDRHIQTLDNFFSSTENDKTIAKSIVTETPSVVTVQRNNTKSNMNFESAMQNEFSPQPFDSLKRKRNSSDPCVQVIDHSNEAISNSSVENNEWSRGIHLTEKNSIQPVTILRPKIAESDKNLHQKTSTMENLNRKGESDSEFRNQRKITPFDVFCRKNRLEVASLNPTISNQEIAQILTEKWDQLSPEEKATYKNEITGEYPKNPKKQEHDTNGTNSNKERNISLRSKKSRKMKHKYLEKHISFNIEMMKNFTSPEFNLKNIDNSIKVINTIAPGIWICLQNSKLLLLNSFRLQEAVVYQRLLETFQLEADPLDSPFVIPTSSFNNDDMDIILHLNHTTGHLNEIMISDERLTANGFELRLKGEREIQVEAVGITKAIAGYGIPELKEILFLIKANNISTKLSDCRPSKVVFYLQGEAVRIAKQYPASKRLEDVEDLLKQTSLLDVRFHSKPFLHVLCSISTDST